MKCEQLLTSENEWFRQLARVLLPYQVEIVLIDSSDQLSIYLNGNYYILGEKWLGDTRYTIDHFIGPSVVINGRGWNNFHESYIFNSFEGLVEHLKYLLELK